VHAYLEQLALSLPTAALFLALAVTVACLGKSADVLVQEAVTLSTRTGVPKVIIGATIVSLGTTVPEAFVSVVAALEGNHGIALGNAVGSVICDTGLILGIACLLGPLPLDKQLLNRQGMIQIGAALLLVLCALPWTGLADTFSMGGRLQQSFGIFFLVLLALYLYISIKWSKDSVPEEVIERDHASGALVVFKMIAALILVAVFAQLLIVLAVELAHRYEVAESVIASTIVAFGTSLPELVTAVSAVRKRHGELAIGNVIGADILNILFVAGAAAAVTPGGLRADPHFFRTLFPAMITILLLFRISVIFSGKTMKRSFGLALLFTYTVMIGLSYF
jgi:cation:H+ antiporter